MADSDAATREPNRLDSACTRCRRCAGCHAPNGNCPPANTTCAVGRCPTEADYALAATRERRDEWKRLAEAATPGPWAIPVANMFRVIAPEAQHTNGPAGATPPYPWCIVADVGHETTGPADAEFIAAARNAVPDLIAQVEALESERDALRTALTEITHYSGDPRDPNQRQINALANRALVGED